MEFVFKNRDEGSRGQGCGQNVLAVGWGINRPNLHLHSEPRKATGIISLEPALTSVLPVASTASAWPSSEWVLCK